MKYRHAFLIGLAFLFTLSACDNVPTESDPATTDTRSLYSGPDPENDDVRNFRLFFWETFRAQDRCGACHGGDGPSVKFVDDEDVNNAYRNAMNYVNLAEPSESLIVAQVAGGHQCWLDPEPNINISDVCAEVLASAITNWAGGSGTTSNKIKLTAPAEDDIRDPGSSRNLPEDSDLFGTTVYPLLRANCLGCHDEAASTPQAPFLANNEVDAAYEAIRLGQKIDLDTPENSRIVVRLRNEFHNCWTNDCEADAKALEDQVIAMRNTIPITELDRENLTFSKAMQLTEGIAASGGSRHEANVIALYTFDTGRGNTIFDTKAIGADLNMTIDGTEGIDFNWVGGWGVQFKGNKAKGTTAASKKLYDLIQATGEYSIEAWITPGNVTQDGPARIISYSGSPTTRNFTLGQTLYNYEFMNRSSTTDANGEPALATADDDEDLQATQQHVVVTYDSVNGRRIYVNGVFTDDSDEVEAGNINNWDDSFALVFGSEVNNDFAWHGTLRLVAIHNRALTEEQIVQNFDAGVGQKFFLLFNVSEHLDIADAYVVLEASQFDSYSYFFRDPFFISLDSEAVPENIRIQGLRIGINGKLSAVGQAYANVDVTLNSSDYNNETGQQLSSLGTIIGSEKGVDDDEFFLAFEVIGNNGNVFVEATPTPPGEAADLDPAVLFGLRLFSEINATMSELTGVPATESNVRTTYLLVEQQLPAVESVEGFLSSHQVGISQLAIEYCNALVEDAGLREAFFPDFDFSATADTAFDDDIKQDQIILPLYDKIIGNDLNIQPPLSTVSTQIERLMTKLACTSNCDNERTLTIVKASCAAVLGSAAVLLQ